MSSGDLFERLRDKSAIKAEDERAQVLAAKSQAQAKRAQQRETELVQNNSTLPVVIDEVRVGTVSYTRRGFLDTLLQPLLGASAEQPYTLAEALEDIGKTHTTLNKLELFKEPIAVYINQTGDPVRPGYPTPLSVLFQSQETSRYKISTGTEVGNGDGSIYGKILLRNLFGGAESLRLDARSGLNTRSAQSAAFTSPIGNNPDFTLELSGVNSTNARPWASHQELFRGGFAALNYLSRAGHQHALTYTGAWRQLTSLTSNASPSIRAEAGDSFKSSVSYSYTVDTRRSALAAVHGRVLPSSGYFTKATAEVAGAGGLGGDVSFAKLAVESQAAIPIFPAGSGFALSVGLRGGVLHPLPMGAFKDTQAPVLLSRFHDRFQLGGHNDVRGFRLSGIGPHDGADALGGDVFAAGGISLTGPLPRAKPDTPVRWHLFVNSGRLIGLSPPSSSLSASMEKSGESTPRSERDWQVVAGSGLSLKSATSAVKNAVEDLTDGLPTTSAGVGLVYAHPLARFELNFSVPVVKRAGEDGRKGFSFGVGMELL